MSDWTAATNRSNSFKSQDTKAARVSCSLLLSTELLEEEEDDDEDEEEDVVDGVAKPSRVMAADMEAAAIREGLTRM